MHRSAIQFYLASLVILLVSRGDAAEPKFDIVIKHGRIVDGSGAPWYEADVGILDGKIVRIGNIGEKEATTVIDATGLVVAPGFIDMMGQTASPMLEDPKTAMNLLTQGITTINAGEGGSAAPLSESEGQRAGYTTMAEYFALVESKGLPLNLVQTIGHTQVRRIVLGDVERRPSDEELLEMQALVREAMEAGAIGVSTALIYPPAIYAPTKEIAALAAVAGEFGGRYYTHMRNEGDRLLEAIDEALDIGREGNTPVHIFHLKTAGQRNWGKMQLALAKIRAARADGQQVTADIYPYVNNGLGIAALVHPRHFADGRQRLLDRLDSQELRNEIKAEIESTDGWENWFLHAGKDWNRIIIGSSNSPTYKPYDGQSLAAMAKACNEDPWDTFFNLVRSDAFALPETMTEANKIMAIQQEFVSFCTDVGPTDGSRSASHPRAYGSFPRLIARYVRDLGIISLEQAVSQASAAAANDVLAYDRGRIAVGLAADVIVFDYEHITDKADFQHPDAVSEGVKNVIVNGQLVLHNSKFTGSLPGRVLRGPGYREEQAAFNVTSENKDYDVERFAKIDQTLQQFIQKHRLPGASLAVTSNGRVVYARGYGYADIAAKKRVEPNSLFRIASISKPITAVAILQLVEQGKLDLQEKVIDTLDYQRDIAALAEFDERLKDITIEHLLEHRGGWDRDKSFDAMFQSVRFANLAGVPPPADQATIIKVMLSQKLDFDPGERYAYSNFGYCLLGRVIERRSGQAYEAYVKEHVLGPLGITTMKLGSTQLAGRAENEVRYYHAGTGKSVFASDLDQTVPWPYGAWNLEAMDSHGGWLASATDLAKFAAAFDEPDHCLILNRASIERMYQRPPGLAGYTADGKEKPTYYSLGWSNQQVDQGLNHSHTGSLPGTATILFRRYDGNNFVVLLNSRASPEGSHLGRAMEPLLREMSVDVAAPSVSTEVGERISK
jgi:N-acyl-D-amino-acid deacylase